MVLLGGRTAHGFAREGEARAVTDPEPIRSEPGGLSAAEVRRRRERGLGNPPSPPSTRTYGQIVRENVFTFVNDILFVLAAALALLGRPLDGLVSLGVIGTNIVVGVVQEVRAKRVLDHIAAVQVPTARVLRDGTLVTVRPEELVLGDVVALETGDVVVLDGTLVAGALEVDESLLTGESDTVHKEPADTVISGSACLSGSGRFVVTAVGEASVANRITAGGRRFRRVLTPLQREIHLVIRVTFAIVVYLQIVLVLDALVSRVPLPEAVAQATVLAGLVPNGLFVAIAITYAAAAVRIAWMGALVQQANAIESLSHVDTICLDKTGTLTANEIGLDSVDAVDGDEPRFRRLVGTMLASAATRNRTAEAILRDCPAEPCPAVAEVPFSSTRAWSAVAVDGAGTLVLGAPSVIESALDPTATEDPAIREVIGRARERAAGGLRVLLLARHPDLRALGDAREPTLPRPLSLVGAVALRDVLRHDLQATLQRFAGSGVSLRVISGDDPETVAALVRQAGLDFPPEVISGPTLDALDEAAFATAVGRTHVFGRITPALKERIVATLKGSGRYVAMIGDGVNDVLPMKRADLAVAMGSGSQATRGVADLVLLDDSFGSLSRAVEEGHRILNGMQPVLELFLTRIATLGVVVMSSLVVEYFPIELRNASAVTLFTVGIPSVLLALWANPRPRPAASLRRTLLRFVAPATLVSSLAGLLLFYGTLLVAPALAPVGIDPVATARSALTAFLVLSGIGLVLFAAPPHPSLAVIEAASADRRVWLLVFGLAAGFGAVLMTPSLRAIFDLDPLPPEIGLLVAGAVGLWAVVLSFTWRRRLVDRFIGIEPERIGGTAES
ncbi:MAG TPA: HAD-IC family P-type ATPase [Candidatus Limnocylindrales bacterium]|nr:HAD-IC family P-type ATPase [Candidatus Limnocylindrales bacterium]